MPGKQKTEKRKDKNVVLFLVEGDSDKFALSNSIEALFDRLNPDYRIVFAYFVKYVKLDDADVEDSENYIYEAKKTGTDITTFKNTTPDNIEERITKYMLVPAMEEYKFYARNVCKVIQIIDTDGVYIPDANIIEEPFIVNGEYETYYDTELELIKNKSAKNIIARNKQKRANIEYLVSLDTIKLDSKQIPYSVYYYSCNLEHITLNNANYKGKKGDAAKAFSDKFIGMPDAFADYFIKDKDAVSETLGYRESWEYMKNDNRSIKRGTNLNLLILDVLNGRMPPPIVG